MPLVVRTVMIARVAAGTGVHPRTLRLWEAAGLIHPVRSGGIRRYRPEDIERARFIQHLSRTGVSLPGIAMILEIGRRYRLGYRELDPSFR